MGMLDDVLKALDRIPIWRRLQRLPAEHDALLARVTELEHRLSGKTGQLCPLCGKPSLIRESSKEDPTFPGTGLMLDSFHCQDCDHREDRPRETLQR